MSANPYRYDPSMDDDIFEDDSQEQKDNYSSFSSDDSEDPFDKIINEILNSDVSRDLSESQIEEIKEAIKYVFPSESAHSLKEFMNFDNLIQKNSKNIGMVQSIFYVLNDITDGKIRQIWRVLDIENNIIFNKKLLNISEEVIADDAEDEEINSINRFIHEFLVIRLDNLIASYMEESEKLEDYEPDFNIVENGTRSNHEENLMSFIMKKVSYNTIK